LPILWEHKEFPFNQIRAHKSSNIELRGGHSSKCSPAQYEYFGNQLDDSFSREFPESATPFRNPLAAARQQIMQSIVTERLLPTHRTGLAAYAEAGVPNGVRMFYSVPPRLLRLTCQTKA